MKQIQSCMGSLSLLHRLNFTAGVNISDDDDSPATCSATAKPPLIKLGPLSLPEQWKHSHSFCFYPQSESRASVPLCMVTSSIEQDSTIGPGWKGQEGKTRRGSGGSLYVIISKETRSRLLEWSPMTKSRPWTRRKYWIYSFLEIFCNIAEVIDLGDMRCDYFLRDWEFLLQIYIGGTNAKISWPQTI